MFEIMARKSMINVRLADKTHEEFKIVAEIRGASMSTILHQFIVKAIREEKEREPQAFKHPLDGAIVNQNLKPDDDVIDVKNEILYSRALPPTKEKDAA